jgi:4-amino-4-deoxy-L-arabinose transferase-like glycosyltransferase
MNSPNPALVSQRAVQRLPRWALLLFCAAYVLPGVFGRDPWRNADVTAFGFMVSMAEGRSSWWMPTVGGMAADPSPLPYWLGAAFIRLLGGGIDPALAARLPFALLLVLVLVLTWNAAYQLARTEAAQPLPFAFGGEANPTDYARAIADGALLALIATLGLLQLGHETTPELGQLTCVALFIYALAASPFKATRSKLAVLIALPALAASGAPSIALALGIAGVVVCAGSDYLPARQFARWVAAAAALTAVMATVWGLWTWQIGSYRTLEQVLNVPRQWLWFLWPVWPMAVWTLWQWRRQVLHRHISVPLSCAMVTAIASVVAGGQDRVLMLSLPAWALLAAFALPTLKRSTAAAVDWFSVFFFSVFAIAMWVVYSSLQTGIPVRPALNVVKLAPGFVSQFSPLGLALAAVASLAWVWLVRWRTRRNQHALWKSLVLPASGVALCWLLLMTLLLPVLDYARSFRPLVNRVALHVPAHACIATPRVQRGLQAALEYFGNFRVDGSGTAATTKCTYLLQIEPRAGKRAAPAGWVQVARESRPTDRTEWAVIYRRLPGKGKIVDR